VVINEHEHEDIIYDDLDDSIENEQDEQADKVEDNIFKIFVTEDYNVEAAAGDIEPFEEIVPEPEKSEYNKLDKLIDQLPEHFPVAEEMIINEIAPHLVDCTPGIKDHYIKVIKKRTNAASIKSVSMLIDEAINEIDESVSAPVFGECSVVPETVDPEIVELANQIAQNPMLFKNKIDLINQLGVINERKNIGLYQLVIDSRLIPMGNAGSDALAMKNSGHYGAGKSFPLFTALKLYPMSAYHLISSGSEKSLYSMEGGLQHKALILAEALALQSRGRKDNELAYAIRTLVSEGHLKYQYTGFKDKKRVTIIKRIEGPTSLLTTTIKGNLEDQLDDRMITAHPNTTTAQTINIIEQTATTAIGNGNLVDENILKAYQHYHDTLISAEVVIPFASDIAVSVSQKGSLPISARRSFKRVLSAIKTVTLLYQKQRSKDDQGRFIAEISDYAIVYQLIEESFNESLGDTKRYTDDRIRLIEKEGILTPRALSKITGVSGAAISQWLKPLIEKGVLNWCDEGGAEFNDVNALEKAKRSGKAYLCVAGGKSLPTPFQLTGDPEWDSGGTHYAVYDLQIDDIVGDLIDTDMGKDNTIRNENGHDREDADPIDEGVKVLSEKSNDDIKKMMKTFRENQNKCEPDDLMVMELSDNFSDILSTENVGAAH